MVCGCICDVIAMTASVCTHVVPTPEAARQLLEANRQKQQNGHRRGNAVTGSSTLVQGTPVIGQRTRPLEQMTLADRCCSLIE